jgi:hypothetical protein
MGLLQLISIAACLLSALVNLDQARKLNAKRRALDKLLRPVCQVLSSDNDTRQLGIFGPSLPEPGTTLYMFDKPPTKSAQDAFHA